MIALGRNNEARPHAAHSCFLNRGEGAGEDLGGMADISPEGSDLGLAGALIDDDDNGIGAISSQSEHIEGGIEGGFNWQFYVIIGDHFMFLSLLSVNYR